MVAEETTTAASGVITSSWIVRPAPAVISAVLTLFFGKRTPGKGAVYGIAAMGAAFVMSLADPLALRAGRRHRTRAA